MWISRSTSFELIAYLITKNMEPQQRNESAFELND